MPPYMKCPLTSHIDCVTKVTEALKKVCGFLLVFDFLKLLMTVFRIMPNNQPKEADSKTNLDK